MFSVLPTHIDGLDAILAGGIRYPEDGSAFVFLTGGPGSGKTVLALELVARQWLAAEDDSLFLYYSVEHSPKSIRRKLMHDFGFYGHDQSTILEEPEEVPHKLVLRRASSDAKLVVTQASPAQLGEDKNPGSIGIDWILAEIGNHQMTRSVKVVCVDNLGLLLTELDFYGRRRALLALRRSLNKSGVHGLFVHEVADRRESQVPSAEEFSTDLYIQLGFATNQSLFKTRTIEIQKARHQYYYRGPHDFSIAGRGVKRDTYLGARNERGPGLHIYPSVPALLSIARDGSEGVVPPRGREPIALGSESLERAFPAGERPGSGSSIVVLAEPGTRPTRLAMQFLAAGIGAGERGLLVSTAEDHDALLRSASATEELQDLLDGDRFREELSILHLHPEFISAGKFTGDLMRLVETTSAQQKPIDRLAFADIHRLEDRFPLLRGQNFMLPALLDMLRYQGVTPMVIELVPQGTAENESGVDPSPYLVLFDAVVHLYVGDPGDGTPRACVKVLKPADPEGESQPLPLRR
ncbi:MAG: ATPase domain-containing protein [Planctomycetota bacterium]